MSQATLGSTPYRNSNLFSGYYLDERVDDLEGWDCDSEAETAFETLRELWVEESDLVAGYKEDELLAAWIDEVLDVLDFGSLSEPTLPDGGGYNDRLLFESDEARREAAARRRDGNTEAMYARAAAVLEAKQWGADFSARFNEARSYRDASHQVKYYLERTPKDLRWGVLTDGKTWRLYGTRDYATETYYEVDLPELLESGSLEEFKYFYAFFRPAAFRETAGTSFLDRVWNESETAAQELGEDLQDNVFTALRVLGEGFIHTNDLDIDPDDEAARRELKEQSLVLLYRLMFVLYAESRGLIHPEEPAEQAEYEENFRRFWQAVRDLQILDPAMGSAHFLTSATGYLTERVMEVVREQEIQSYDEQELRRDIAKECIYGVDINGMAVELGKLSMWLETLAADKPLAFLDHHLKTGNSLVGSDITEVLSDDTDENGGQLTLTQVAARARRQTLEHVMDLMQDLLAIENDELEDIKSMEEIYDEIRSDALYQRLFEIANVHTAEQFGLDVPRDGNGENEDDAYRAMAKAIEDGDAWADIREKDWFASAQAMADEEDFFHWELEFPEVFFGEDGERMEEAGFDAVVGNPPYFNLETTKGTRFNDYLRNQYEEIYSGKADVLYFFCTHGYDLVSKSGKLSFIISRYFTEAFNAKDFREQLTNKADIQTILDFGNNQIFPGVDTLTIVLSLTGPDTQEFTNIFTIDDELNSDPVQIEAILSELQSVGESESGGSYKIPQEAFGRERWLILPEEKRQVKQQIEFAGTTLGSFCRTGQGMMTGLNEAFTVTKEEIDTYNIEEDVLRPLVKNGDLRRYLYRGNEKDLIYLENKEVSEYPNTKKYLEQYRSGLESRAKADSVRWYRYQNPINKDLFEDYDQKIICPFIATDNRFYVDKNTLFNDGGDIELILQDESSPISNYYLIALLNSKLLEFYHLNHAKLKRDGFYEYFGNSLQELPIVLYPDENIHEKLHEAAVRMTQLKQEVNDLNLSVLDYFGDFSDGDTLSSVGFTQPPERAADSILQATAEKYPNLRVGEATVTRESPTTVTARLTARYKPDDEDAYETDQWGYTETDPLPALRVTDLTETEADLVEAFVPVAVDEAGGFAGFRETATKTNSLVDRLRALALPAVADVREGLESYRETRARADELETKIERTDELIDEIVYDLYGLTEEEVAVVEETVGE